MFGSTTVINNLSETFLSGLGIFVGVYHSAFHHTFGELTLFCATQEESKDSWFQKSYCLREHWKHEQFELCQLTRENNLLPFFFFQINLLPSWGSSIFITCQLRGLYQSMYVSTSNVCEKHLKTPGTDSSLCYTDSAALFCSLFPFVSV